MSKKIDTPWDGGAEGFATENPRGKVEPVRQTPRKGTLAAKLYENQPLERNDGSGEAATVDEREAEALKDSIPADVIERVLAKGSKQLKPSTPAKGIVLPPVKKSKRQIVRGDVLIHKPSGRQVTIVKPDVGLTGKGVIKHRVMTRGLTRKFVVPESALEEVP